MPEMFCNIILEFLVGLKPVKFVCYVKDARMEAFKGVIFGALLYTSFIFASTKAATFFYVFLGTLAPYGIFLAEDINVHTPHITQPLRCQLH